METLYLKYFMMVFECGDLSLTSKEGQLNVCQVYFILFFNSEKVSQSCCLSWFVPPELNGKVEHEE